MSGAELRTETGQWEIYMERDFQETVNGVDTGTTPNSDVRPHTSNTIRGAIFPCCWPFEMPRLSAIASCGTTISARGIETCRRSFNWRIRRLTDAGIVQKLPPLFPYPGPVYTITRAGIGMS